MKQNLAALEVYAVIKELQFLVGGKLDKIYNPSKKELLLIIHVPSKGKQIIRIVAGKLIYSTDYKPKSDAASSFCIYLRKKLLGTRLRKIEQKDFERVIELKFENNLGKLSLFIELFGKGNIVLVQDGIILSAVEQQKWADRSVMPKEKYVFPQKEINFLSMSETEFRDFCKKSKQETIVKTLAMDLGLGKTYAEEVCLKSKINKNDSPNLGRKKLEVIFKELEKLKLSSKGYIYDSGLEITPIKLDSLIEKKVEVFESYNLALNNFFTNIYKSEERFQVSVVVNKEKNKIQKIIDIQKKVYENLESEEKVNREKGEILYNNYQLVSQIILQLRDALKKYNSDEINKRLKNHKMVKDYNEKDKSVVIEL